MCVCIVEILVLKIFIERWFWELNMLIGSFVELDVGLHSCLCFSHLKKLVLKAGSTPCCLSSFFSCFLSLSRQFLDTWWIDRESSCLLDSFSTLGRSIELLFLDLMSCSLILARYLSYRRPFPQYLPRYLSIPESIELYWGSIY